MRDDLAASDVPGEQTADPEEAFAAEPYVRPVEPAGQPVKPPQVGPGDPFLNRDMYEGWIQPTPKRREELAEERASRYTREDGTPK